MDKQKCYEHNWAHDKYVSKGTDVCVCVCVFEDVGYSLDSWLGCINTGDEHTA